MKYLVILGCLLLATAQSTHAFLDYCQDIVLPVGYRFSDEKFPLCHFEMGLSVVSSGGRYGFADEGGKVRIAAQFEEAYNFQEGLALIKHNGKYGYINPQGIVIIRPTYDDAWGFSEGLAKVSVHGKIGFVNKQGVMSIAPTFDDSKDWFEAGVIAVFDKASQKWGMIDRTGRLITPYVYERIDEPSYGRVLIAKQMAVGEGGLRFGYLDLKGNVVIGPQFLAGSQFKNGVAEVIGEQGVVQYINIQGKRIEQKANFDY